MFKTSDILVLFWKWFGLRNPESVFGTLNFSETTLWEPPGRRHPTSPLPHSKAEKLNNTEVYSFPTYQSGQYNLEREFFFPRRIRKLVSAVLWLTPSQGSCLHQHDCQSIHVAACGKRKEKFMGNYFVCKSVKQRLHNFPTMFHWQQLGSV